MSGALGLAALLFAVLVAAALAWAMWDGDRRDHQRKLEAIQRRLEKIQEEKADNGGGSENEDPPKSHG